MHEAIVFEDYSLEMNGREILRRVSFSVAHGEVAGLFGRAGSGKTQLAMSLCGPRNGSDGILRVLDRPIARPSSSISRAVSVGFQAPSFAPDLTVQENLDLQSALWRIPWRKRKGRTAFLAQFLGLEPLLRDRVGRLSAEQQRAVEIARALVPEAPVVVLDSLLDSADPDLRNKLFRHMFEVARTSNTAFLLTTSSSEVAELCDKSILLDRGRVVAAGAPDDLRSGSPDEVVVVQSVDNPALRKRISERFKVVVREENGELRFSIPHADLAAAEILSELDSQVECVKVRRPTLHEITEALAASAGYGRTR